MLFLFSVSGSKSHVFPLFAAHRPVFSKSLSRFSPPDFDPFSHLVEERFPPALQAFCLRSPRASFTVFILVSLRQSSLQTKTAWSRPSNGAARLLLSAFECGFPRISRRPVSPEKPFLRSLSALRVVCSRSVPSSAAACASCPFFARIARSAHGFVFPSCTVSRLSNAGSSFSFPANLFGLSSRLLSAPVRGFPAALFGSNAQKKGRQLPAPIFIYIKNFPMYP